MTTTFPGIFSNASQSTKPPAHDGSFDYVFHSVLMIIAFLIILTNGLVMVLFRTGVLWRTKSNYLLLSLSVTDLATGVVAIPMNITCECTVMWTACLLSFEMNRFIGISTISHILVLTLEKYTAVMYPMLHRRIVTKRNVTVVIVTAWLLSLLVALIPLEWLLGLRGVKNRFTKSSLKKQTIHETFVFVVFFVLPLATMFACYARLLGLIVMHAFSSAGKRAKESTPCNVSRYRRFNPMVLVLVMLFIFILSWGWWFFGTIQRAHENEIPAISNSVRSILVVVRYSSSFLNPLLYSFFKRDFKLAFKHLVSSCVMYSTRTEAQINMARRPREAEQQMSADKKYCPILARSNKKVTPTTEQQ